MFCHPSYVGVFFAVATFIALVAMIWAQPEDDGHHWSVELIEAFVIAVTIIVVAIPEVRSITALLPAPEPSVE